MSNYTYEKIFRNKPINSKDWQGEPNLNFLISKILKDLRTRDNQEVKDYDLEIIINFNSDFSDWNITLRSYFLIPTEKKHIVFETESGCMSLMEALDEHVMYIHENSSYGLSVDSGYRNIIDYSYIHDDISIGSSEQSSDFNNFMEWAILEVLQYLDLVLDNFIEEYVSTWSITENAAMQALEQVFELDSQRIHDVFFEYIKYED